MNHAGSVVRFCISNQLPGDNAAARYDLWTPLCITRLSKIKWLDPSWKRDWVKIEGRVVKINLLLRWSRRGLMRAPTKAETVRLERGK